MILLSTNLDPPQARMFLMVALTLSASSFLFTTSIGMTIGSKAGICILGTPDGQKKKTNDYMIGFNDLWLTIGKLGSYGFNSLEQTFVKLWVASFTHVHEIGCKTNRNYLQLYSSKRQLRTRSNFYFTYVVFLLSRVELVERGLELCWLRAGVFVLPLFTGIVSYLTWYVVLYEK